MALQVRSKNKDLLGYNIPLHEITNRITASKVVTAKVSLLKFENSKEQCTRVNTTV